MNKDTICLAFPPDLHPAKLRHSNMILLSEGAATANTVTLAAPIPFYLSEAELTGPQGETERYAILLECCELPDKQLTLTESDLDDIVSRFTPDIPVKLQHTDTPLDPFGVVKTIQRVGKQLLGRVSFAPAIAALIRERGAAALSCGLERDPLKLSEVSLVFKGRIPAATLLADDEKQRREERAELARLRAEITSQRVDAQIFQLKLAGKVIPATEAAARVLLSAGDGSLITLADGQTQSVAEAFTAYLSAQPALITLGELTALNAGGSAGAASGGNAGGINNTPGQVTEETFSPEQRAWMEKALGVKPADVAKTMETDRQARLSEGRHTHSDVHRDTYTEPRRRMAP